MFKDHPGKQFEKGRTIFPSTNGSTVLNLIAGMSFGTIICVIYANEMQISQGYIYFYEIFEEKII